MAAARGPPSGPPPQEVHGLYALPARTCMVCVPVCEHGVWCVLLADDCGLMFLANCGTTKHVFMRDMTCWHDSMHNSIHD
jgi:hypothetical protein